MTLPKTLQKGFTIVELMVAITIGGILTIIITVITVYFYGDILRSQATAELASESQIVLRRIIEDVRLADAIRSTNQLPDTNAPTGGWTTNDPSDILIIANPAIDSSRNIIYDITDGYPYENESIYFKSGVNFYRRQLKNTNAAGNTAVTTCPAAAVSASCPGDILLTNSLTNLSFVFYDINNATTSDATQARSISITINMQRRIYGQMVTFNNTIRTTLRNY